MRVGIVEGPPFTQVLPAPPPPGSRRKVDAPPDDALDVGRSIRDDQTIGRRRVEPHLPFVMFLTWTSDHAGWVSRGTRSYDDEHSQQAVWP
jgi:hypothetical protein